MPNIEQTVGCDLTTRHEDLRVVPPEPLANAIGETQRRDLCRLDEGRWPAKTGYGHIMPAQAEPRQSHATAHEDAKAGPCTLLVPLGSATPAR